MNKDNNQFDRLVSDALSQPTEGWDFSYLQGRWQLQPSSWDYPEKVRQRMRDAIALLDMGTGGGELLSTLAPLPRMACATEGYPPNVHVAQERLRPLGVQVVHVEESQARLPFQEAAFDLVINRHAGYSAREVHRILKPGCCFITQQVGGSNNVELNKVLGGPPFRYAYWTLAYALGELEQAGFVITEQIDELRETEFYDIGAVVYYLHRISWQIDDFSEEKYSDRLSRLHELIQVQGKLVTHYHRFYIEARKV